MPKEHKKYKNKLQEYKFFQLIKNSKFYYSLVFPLLLSFIIYISKSKAQIVIFSIFFGLSLLPLLKTFLELYKINDYEN
jgi:hypothetical protein